MSSHHAQMYIFFTEVSESQALYFARYEDGTLLELECSEGKPLFPVWSSEFRLSRLKKLAPERWADLEVKEISWAEFRNNLVPMLDEAGWKISVNPSGKEITGLEMLVTEVVENIEAGLNSSS